MTVNRVQRKAKQTADVQRLKGTGRTGKIMLHADVNVEG